MMAYFNELSQHLSGDTEEKYQSV